MSRRVGIIGIVVLVAIVTAVGVRTPLPRRPAVSRDQFSRIEKGMSRGEIEAIIGGPPGDYATRRWASPSLGMRYVGWDEWVGDEGMIFVRFDEVGRADDVEYMQVWWYIDNPTFFERMRAWIGG